MLIYERGLIKETDLDNTTMKDKTKVNSITKFLVCTSNVDGGTMYFTEVPIPCLLLCSKVTRLPMSSVLCL
jgi:hypothetical protein